MIQHKYVVATVLIDTRGAILLQDRTSISKYGEERSFFGGHMEDGETIIETAQRELLEELHLSVGEDYIHYTGTTVHKMAHNDVWYTRHICLIPVDNVADHVFTDYEGSGATVARLEDLPTLLFNTDMSQECALITYAYTHRFDDLFALLLELPV